MFKWNLKEVFTLGVSKDITILPSPWIHMKLTTAPTVITNSMKSEFTIGKLMLCNGKFYSNSHNEYMYMYTTAVIYGIRITGHACLLEDGINTVV